MDNTVSIGVVSSIDTDTGMVRVTFPDRDDMVSPPMPLLCIGTGSALRNAMPEAGDNVVCIFRGTQLADGICLGTLYDGSYDMPADPDAEQGIYFEDGSSAYFDRATGTIIVDAIGDVQIVGENVSITADSVQIRAQNVSITAQSVIVNAPVVRLNSNLTVKGTITELGEVIDSG